MGDHDVVVMSRFCEMKLCWGVVCSWESVHPLDDGIVCCGWLEVGGGNCRLLLHRHHHPGWVWMGNLQSPNVWNYVIPEAFASCANKSDKLDLKLWVGFKRATKAATRQRRGRTEAMGEIFLRRLLNLFCNLQLRCSSVHLTSHRRSCARS